MLSHLPLPVLGLPVLRTGIYPIKKESTPKHAFFVFGLVETGCEQHDTSLPISLNR